MGAPSPAVAAGPAESARLPGRPRSEECSKRILDAALQCLVEEGYGAMTIEGVAARAGVGKATLYRRWANKADLAADAITDHTGTDVALVDTGDVRADLRAIFRALVDAMAGIEGALFLSFAAERIRHPELADAFDRRFLSVRRAHLRALIGAGVARGELPADSDVELLAGVGPAAILYELTNRRPLGSDLADRIIAQFFPG